MCFINKFILTMQSRTTMYQNIISQHKCEQFFSFRSKQLIKIASYHCFPIEKFGFNQHPVILYKSQPKFDLQQLINDEVELHPSDIKCMIWQITKFMLNCEEAQANHLRLSPKTIILKDKYQPESPLFLWVKDFSMGKEFQSVRQGKKMQIFEYLHPSLSLENKMIDFEYFQAQLDIWSLGIILYKLIYFQSPFCKPGKHIFSKTILREYLAGDYKIRFGKQRFREFNMFILNCLSNRGQESPFKGWKSIKRYILQQPIYNQLDFHDGFFEEMAKIHIKLMVFFSNIYCMIIDQCNQSPNAFWKIPISRQRKIPFQLQICELTLSLMCMLEQRFKFIYSSHFFMLKKETVPVLRSISQKIENEWKFMENKWIEPAFKAKKLNPSIIHLAQDICVKVKLEASQQDELPEMSHRIGEDFDSKRITMMRSSLLKKKDVKNNRGIHKESKLWKKVQILFDYCSQMLLIATTTKQDKFKFIFEELYINSVFDSILIQEFHYSTDLTQVFKKVYKEYLMMIQ